MKSLLRKLSLTSHQLKHLMNELSGRNELYWLQLMYRFPLSVEQCRDLRFYKQLSDFIHILKPGFPRILQIWAALYFTVLFSDGFESGDFTAWTNWADVSAGTLSVSTDAPHHGTYGAKFVSDGIGWGGYGRPYQTIGGAYTEVYARLYFKWMNPIWGDARFYSFYIFRSPETAFLIEPQVVRQDATNYYWKVGTSVSATFTPSTNQWYCLEVGIKVNSANGFRKLWVDGVLVIDAVVDYSTNSRISTIFAGLCYKENAPAVETWYWDCVVIADSYIGPEVTESRGFVLARTMRTFGSWIPPHLKPELSFSPRGLV